MKWLAVIVGLGINVFFGSFLKETSENVWRISRTLQAWEDEGIPDSAIWHVRERLASHWWLGPLRPNPPHDPVKDYMSHGGTTGWILMFRPHETRQLLSRLENHIRKAKEEQLAFGRNIMWSMVSYVFLAAGLFLLRLLFFYILFPNSMSSTPSTIKKALWGAYRRSETNFPPGDASRSSSSHLGRT